MRLGVPGAYTRWLVALRQTSPDRAVARVSKALRDDRGARRQASHLVRPSDAFAVQDSALLPARVASRGQHGTHNAVDAMLTARAPQLPRGATHGYTRRLVARM